MRRPADVVWPQERDRDWLERAYARNSVHEIARGLGIPPIRVEQALLDARIPLRPKYAPPPLRGASDDEVDEVLRGVRKTVDLTDVTQALALRRRLVGMSQTELARRIGVSPTYISKLESGDRTTATLPVLDQWADAVGVRIRVTLEEETDPGRS